MEITTAPYRPASTPWGRLLALVVILGPVTVLVLLPIGLGLQRYVMSGDSMAGDRPDSIPRGAVVFERLVPVDDLEVGDVITFRPPPSADADGMVTHRIVAIDASGIVTQGDGLSRPDPWRLQPEGSVVPRVVLSVPWVGYAYLVLADPVLWALLLGTIGLLGVLVTANVVRSQRRTPAAVGVGAGTDR